MGPITSVNKMPDVFACLLDKLGIDRVKQTYIAQVTIQCCSLA